jgi:endoribonuclease Dicer
MDTFKKIFTVSKDMSIEIGSWGVDQHLKFALAEEEQLRETEGRLQHSNQTRQGGIDTEQYDTEMGLFREATQIVSNHHFPKPTTDGGNLSQKVLYLRAILVPRFDRPSSHRCIVFVKKRATARLLCLLFQHPNIGGPDLKPGLLIGLASKNGDAKQSFREQILMMKKFRTNEVNCLVCHHIFP